MTSLSSVTSSTTSSVDKLQETLKNFFLSNPDVDLESKTQKAFAKTFGQSASATKKPVGEKKPRKTKTDVSSATSSTEAASAGKVKKTNVVKDPNAPKTLPTNPFILFSTENRVKTLAGMGPETKNPEVAAKLGVLWKELPEDQKDVYRQRAAANKTPAPALPAIALTSISTSVGDAPGGPSIESKQPPLDVVIPNKATLLASALKTAATRGKK